MATETHAEVHWIKGMTFVGKSDSNHWVVMDGPKEFGGSEAATRPVHLFLIGLAGCTGSDVASILEKKRIALDKLLIKVTAERAEEHPKVFTKIHIEYLFHGKNLKAKDLERAIALSQDKYCPASAMLRPSVPITHSYQIIASEA